MEETEGTYRVLQTPGARLGTQRNAGISTLEPGQNLNTALSSSPPKSSNHDMQSYVQLLDGTWFPVDIGPKTTGQALLSQLFTPLNVVETDYFGVEFQTAQSHWVWLEQLKSVTKQLRKPKNAKMRLAVKFFPPDPGQLQEEYTRYLFALQIQRDLGDERLTCSDNTTALLISLLMQSEIGDYDQKTDLEHLKSTLYVQRQHSLEERIVQCHQQHIGMSPADADFQILEIARRLDLYGTRFYLASDKEGAKINLSASHTGVLVFQGSTKINTFNWSKIRKLSFKRRRFLIKLHPEVHGPYQDALEFQLPSRDMCKRFWKICVEYHSFFRLQDQPKPKSKAVLFSRGSSFRYSGRTQKQLIDYVRDNSLKRPPSERRHSKARVSPCTVIPDSPKQNLFFTESVTVPASPSPPSLAPYSTPTVPYQKRQPNNDVNVDTPPQEEPSHRDPEEARHPTASPIQGLSPQPNPSLHSRPDSGGINDVEKSKQGENVRLWVSEASDSLLLTEEFIDDDPADISFGGGAELYSYSGREVSPIHEDLPPDEFYLEEMNARDFNGNARPTDATELFEMKAQASLMQSLLSPSENSSLLQHRSESSSLLHHRSESSSLSNLNGIPPYSHSANHSTASSMINFPACSVRSESSSAFQFGDILDQLEQLSYPPTTTEDSSSSEGNSWDSEEETPLDINLFFSNPLTNYHVNLNQFGIQDKRDIPDILKMSYKYKVAYTFEPKTRFLSLASAGSSCRPINRIAWLDLRWCRRSAVIVQLMRSPNIVNGLHISTLLNKLTSQCLCVFICLGCYLSPVTLSLPSSNVQTGSSPLLSPALSDSGSGRTDDLEESSENKMEEAYYITKEILSTETSHIKDIEVITVWLHGALCKGGVLHGASEKLMKPLFFNMASVHQFHQNFVQQLEDVLALWSVRLGALVDMPTPHSPPTSTQIKARLIPTPRQGYLLKRVSCGYPTLERPQVIWHAPTCMFIHFLLHACATREGRSAHSKDTQIIGDFMLRNMTSLRALLPLLHRLEDVFPELQNKSPSHQEVEVLLQEFEQHRVCYLPLSCLLLKPLQRPLQYEKLLERLCRHYPPSHHDYNNCQRALGEASAVSSQLRHRLLHLQNLQRLHQLQKDLLGGENLASPGREFIREGCLFKLTKSGLQQRMFYLFSDMLLYTRKGLSCTNQFRVHARLPLHGMLAEDIQSSVPHCFTIYSAQTTIGVAASSQLDMRQWLEDLNAAVSRAPRCGELPAPSLQRYRGILCVLCTEAVVTSSAESHHPNTLSHVCWYRNQSVSLADHIAMMENQLSGYLLRKFKNSNGWQRLWVVFTNFCLFFYKTHQEDAPLASLPLLGYTVSVPSHTDPVSCRHVFKLHFKSHVYFFRADSEYTWRRWMEVIRRCVSSPGKIGHFSEDGNIK
ncbi:FERM, ARHGEF and pleckstrin domain-containing protein 2 [Spea bombifrons]|uniref:FERM, ARHGEF and pleckstrin domain-containing protein 2 n=1 Tax=Spea bombifrons TaxID=233779 RepID=UPI00234976DE|nr:FERM, ARHGEF and pleckstrin domain-containing protein 2 [Spea bombifrons]